jgi:serine phosphatase RsbU (regulator of sigma subunit)/anti-sigma regulatory factor (Ser/Thr protein kinase)
MAQGREWDEEAARVQVELAVAAAGATPLAELLPTTRDLSRVQPLLEQLAGALGNLLATDLAVVWTTDPTEDVLLPSAWVGFPDDYIAPLRVPYGMGSAGQAILERRTVLVEDVATSEHYGPFRAGAMAHGVRTVLSVPMLTLAGEPMGTLTTYYRESFRPDERDLELAGVYARQAAEIVERARLHAEARQLAALEQRRGMQLRALADSALALSAADSLDELLSLVTEAAVEVVGCHQGVTTRLPHGWVDATTYVSLSEKYAGWRDYDVVPKGLGVLNAVTRENRPLRLTPEQLVAHPDWRGLRDAPNHPPLPDYLAAPLIGRDGSNLGLIQLSHKLDETPFSAEDEAILVQLAQMASSTIERLEAFEGERAARREAEAAALLRGVLSEASAVFAESFDPDGIAAALVSLVVPRLAELSLLHLVDEAGDLLLSSCHAQDSAVAARARTFFGAAPILPGVPYGPAAVLATGQPQLLPETTLTMARAVTVTDEQATVLHGILRRSNICVPLTARGRTLGVLTLSREQEYETADVEHALDLARRAALAVDNAARYAFERDVAMTLQRSLLPRALSVPRGLTAAARYLPGARGTQVGGDWYDLLEVGGKVVLVVGDVMGRGVQAAAMMGQLRATLRAYAIEGHGPVDVLKRLDHVVLSLTGLHFTTCLVGVLDPAAGKLCLASAGHLPPVVVCPDGQARLVDLDPGLPLGVGGGQFVEQSLDLAPGSLVLLYSDGLVESRGASLEQGMDRLVAALSVRPTSAEQACDLVLHELGREGDQDDDTALLALLLDPVAPATLELTLDAVPQSASVARAAVRDLLGPLRLSAESVELLVSELVGNAVRHAAGATVVLRAAVTQGRVRVEVQDASPRLPGAAGAPSWEQENGRGLQLVEAIAQRWGTEPVPGGKYLWFEISPPGRGG